MASHAFSTTPVEVGPRRLQGILGLPADPTGIVIFAHGSGSGRLSPRNSHVAAGLMHAGLATLLLDLLTPLEEQDRRNVFDIPLLAKRLAEAAEWASTDPRTTGLPIGYFGASTGGGAALLSAAWADGRIGAVVSRGGRPDLAGDALAHVKVPTLLIVGSLDIPVIAMNQQALDRLTCEKQMVVVPGAGHLFEEAGTLDIVVNLATRWFTGHLANADSNVEHDHA
jgi:putative phosphoribosyl transferase